MKSVVCLYLFSTPISSGGEFEGLFEPDRFGVRGSGGGYLSFGLFRDVESGRGTSGVHLSKSLPGVAAP